MKQKPDILQDIEREPARLGVLLPRPHIIRGILSRIFMFRIIKNPLSQIADFFIDDSLMLGQGWF